MQSKKEHLQQFLSAAIAPNGDRLRATSKGQLGCFVGFRESGAQPLGPGSKMIPLKPSPLPINEPAVDCVKKVWGHKMCPTTGKRSTLCPCCKGGSLCLQGRQQYKCKECDGSSFCAHGTQKSRWIPCKGSRWKFEDGRYNIEHGKLNIEY